MHDHRYREWKASHDPEVHCGDAFGSQRALLILEAQHILIEFLLDITSIILEDAGTEVPRGCAIQDLAACDKWMKFVGNGPRTD